MGGVPVRGRVIDASTGSPVGDAAVTLRRKDANTAGFPLTTVPTDASGNFTFDSIPAGAYRATAEKKGYGAETNDVVVTESGAEAVELKLAPANGLTLRVEDLRDHRTLNAWYRAISSTGEVYDDYIRFMSSSTEPITIPLPAGSYWVMVGAEGYAPRSYTMNSPGAQTVSLTPGGTILVSTSTTGGDRGRILDSAGRSYSRGGMRGGPPTFRIEGAPMQSTLENIAPGRYTIQVLDEKDAVLRSATVEVSEGQTVTIKM
jgi:hypothetical protein